MRYRDKASMILQFIDGLRGNLHLTLKKDSAAGCTTC